MQKIISFRTKRHKAYTPPVCPANYIKLVGTGKQTLTGSVIEPANYPAHITEF